MANQVRLLAIINSRIKKLGSFEDYIVAYASEARKRRWPLGLVLPSIGAEEFVGRVEAQQAVIVSTNSCWGSKSGNRELINVIREFKPNVVNFHFCDTANFFPVFSFCRRARAKVIYHYHGEIRPLHTLHWRNRHFSSLRLLSFKWNRVVTVSEANKRFLEGLHVATPIEVVYNGIEVERFLTRSVRFEDDATLKRKEPDIVRCIYIGSVIDRKRVDILLRAFALALKQFPATHLTIVGGGELEASIQKLAVELGLNGHVQFTGLTIQYPYELLKQSDIFVSASESESFGLVFTEAMSFGLPIVACQVGGIPEVIEHEETGLLVEANDPPAFATALLRLLQDPALRLRMGRAGLSRVREKFQLHDTIGATFQCIARVAEPR